MEFKFQMDVMNDPSRLKTITLKASCGQRDVLEPVITAMFPEED